MIADVTLQLAHGNHAQAIALMSRERIEKGLAWSWTPRRVLRCIADPDTNVVVALDSRGGLQGFAIMNYGDEQAHLSLLAVRSTQGRRGIGSALLRWLEATALAAGIGHITLEARAGNVAARAFYRRLGYREIQVVPGYYGGCEACVHITKHLQPGRPARA
jgi:ribosomal-protein-alanine N-acetyltransferase